MSTCPACHQPLEPDSVFCGSCGAAVSGTSEIPRAQQTVARPVGPTSGTGNGRQTSAAPRSATANPILTHRGFFSALFDLSFTSFVTPKIIKVVYAISMIGIGLVTLGLILAAFHESSALGLLVLVIIAPLGALFALIYTRVIMEQLVALVRIAENTSEMVVQGRVGR
jgi:Domain of unknown function (DUF4282)